MSVARVFAHDLKRSSRLTLNPWEVPRTMGLMLMLLPLLRSRPPRIKRLPRQEWDLPKGCAFAVRYRSR